MCPLSEYLFLLSLDLTPVRQDECRILALAGAQWRHTEDISAASLNVHWPKEALGLLCEPLGHPGELMSVGDDGVAPLADPGPDWALFKAHRGAPTRPICVGLQIELHAHRYGARVVWQVRGLHGFVLALASGCARAIEQMEWRAQM